MTSLIECVGCGALVSDLPASYGPEHTYLGASPGCWQIYTELTARNVPSLTVRGLMADTYMVQHPGVASPKSIQSVARHLMGLYLALERQVPFQKAVQLMSAASVKEFYWLEPPALLGGLTLVDLAQQSQDDIAEGPVRAWAISTWQAWALYHPIIQRWATYNLG